MEASKQASSIIHQNRKELVHRPKRAHQAYGFSSNENRRKIMTPLRAIRLKCLWCCLDQSKEVRLCPSENSCALWSYRFGKLPTIDKPSPLKAIRARCLDCVGMSPKEVAECKTNCTLNAFRFGKNPNYSAAHRQRAKERILKRQRKKEPDHVGNEKLVVRKRPRATTGSHSIVRKRTPHPVEHSH